MGFMHQARRIPPDVYSGLSVVGQVTRDQPQNNVLQNVDVYISQGLNDSQALGASSGTGPVGGA